MPAPANPAAQLPAVPLPGPLVPPAKPTGDGLPALPAVPPPVSPKPDAPKPVLPAVPPPNLDPLMPPIRPADPLAKPAPLTVPPPDLPSAKPADAPRLPAVPPPTPVQPGGDARPLAAPNPVPADRQVVLLADGKLVEGVVTAAGEKVVVRRAGGDQVYAADQVQFVGASKDAAYRFLKAKAEPGDAAGRVRLARWCMLGGMREQALEEAREAAKLQPGNAAATGMVRTLEESLRLYPGDGSTPARPATPPHQGADAPRSPSPEVEVTPEAASAFGPKVEPLLLNACAACHARGSYAGAFKLTPRDGFAVDPDATRKNLRAAAGQLRKDDTGCSPLLSRTLAAHGGMKTPAVAGRHTPAFQALEAWAYAAVGAAGPAMPSATTPATTAPPLPPVAPGSTPQAPVLPAVPPPIPPAAGTTPPSSPLPALPAVPPPTGGAFGQAAKPQPPAPAKPGDPADEFDPAAYNRTAPPPK